MVCSGEASVGGAAPAAAGSDSSRSSCSPFSLCLTHGMRMAASCQRSPPGTSRPAHRQRSSRFVSRHSGGASDVSRAA